MKPWPKVRLGEVLRRVVREEKVDALKEYRLLGIRLEGKGPFLRETVMGTQTSAGKLFCVATGDFIYSRLFAGRGAFGVITEALDGCYVSGEFPIFVPMKCNVDVEFLKYWFRLPSVIATVDAESVQREFLSGVGGTFPPGNVTTETWSLPIALIVGDTYHLTLELGGPNLSNDLPTGIAAIDPNRPASITYGGNIYMSPIGACITKAPDAGSSLALLAIGISGIAFLKSRRVKIS